MRRDDVKKEEIIHEVENFAKVLRRTAVSFRITC